MHKQELERAKALRAVQVQEEEDAAIMRVQYSDADVSTLLTVAMMAGILRPEELVIGSIELRHT